MIDKAVEKLLPTLNHMKKNPGMWFQESALLEGLYGFWLGYSISAKDLANLKVFELGPPFTRWLVDEKSMKGDNTQPWSEILRQNAIDDRAAYDLFFELLSEYNDWPQIDGDLAKF